LGRLLQPAAVAVVAAAALRASAVAAHVAVAAQQAPLPENPSSKAAQGRWSGEN
jgi:invasion protein IalB